MGEHQSDVARLMAQISSEYESGRNALFGQVLGTAQHAFITKRMENIGEFHEQLIGLVGDDAIALIAQSLDQLGTTNPQ